MLALYRPGPMDLIPAFIKRKKGEEKVEYLHPLLEEVSKETYGILIYQEQVQKAANLLAGYYAGQPRTCCAAPWARRSPRRWRSSARSS